MEIRSLFFATYSGSDETLGRLRELLLPKKEEYSDLEGFSLHIIQSSFTSLYDALKYFPNDQVVIQSDSKASHVGHIEWNDRILGVKSLFDEQFEGLRGTLRLGQSSDDKILNEVRRIRSTMDELIEIITSNILSVFRSKKEVSSKILSRVIGNGELEATIRYTFYDVD